MSSSCCYQGFFPALIGYSASLLTQKNGQSHRGFIFPKRPARPSLVSVLRRGRTDLEPRRRSLEARLFCFSLAAESIPKRAALRLLLARITGQHLEWYISEAASDVMETNASLSFHL